MATIFSQLRPIAEEFLTGYRDDFFVHDKKTLRTLCKPGESYIWVCRETGTHLQIVNAPEDSGVDMGDLAWSWDMLDAVRGMGDAVKAVYSVEMLGPRQHGQITKLDAIPPRPAALVGVAHGKKIFA